LRAMSRYPASVKYWQYRFLVERDGAKCKICGVSEREKKLVIAHLDGDPSNNDPRNLSLLCRGCNTREWWKMVRSGVSVREKVEGVAVERQMDVEREPPEMKVMREKRPEYTKWLLENVMREGGVTMWEAIYEGSKALDLSPITCRRYLYQELSRQGLFKLGDGPRGHRRILIKEEPFLDDARPQDTIRCELCGRGFKRLSEKDLHMIEEHSTSGRGV